MVLSDGTIIQLTDMNFHLRYLTGLLSWDKIKLFDPEQAKFNGNIYPIPARYTLQVYINM
jgi:hypothetical protein